MKLEQLKNCPQCGGILNEAGRCQFCGSKVYDFLAIDFGYTRKNLIKRPKTYLRIRDSNDRIILMPVVVTNFSEKIEAPCIYCNTLGESSYTIPMRSNIELEVNFAVIGDIIIEDDLPIKIEESKDGTV